jgi:hypothetical protein
MPLWIGKEGNMGNVDKRLQAEKEQNILQELMPKAEQIKKDIEAKHGVVLYAMIRPVGIPIINITQQDIPMNFLTKHITLLRNKAIASYELKLREILKSFYDECVKIGIMPVAKIAENGAEIFFMLTQTKRDEISPIVLPNSVHGKGILIPQGIGEGK